jgi:response regulator RpfG family c-di-GMP phosphodiesterase
MARIVVVHEIAANHERVLRSLPEHEILPFGQIDQAMHFLEQNRADLIISAVHLLEGNVFDFLRWTKSDANLRGIPFVFFCAEPTELSRYVSNAVKHAAQILGASRYIAMDTFDAAEFHAVITEVLDSDAPHITTSHLQAFRDWAANYARKEIQKEEHKPTTWM